MSLLKIYGPDRQALFSMEAAETGNVEDKPALNDALERGADCHGEVYAPGFPDSQGDYMTRETIREMAFEFMLHRLRLVLH